MNASEETRDVKDAQAATDPAGGASIDKVRDILFGGQMRDYDKRFARLEERLTKDTAELRDEIRKRLSALEQFVHQEVAAIGDRLAGEQHARLDAEKALGDELREAGRAFERRTAAMDDQSSRAQRELRQALLEQAQRLTDEIQQRHEELLGVVGRASGELRDEKADRAALASLFTEMALRLSHQFRLPTEGD
jgi:DNA anti-recombination protein RmuC